MTAANPTPAAPSLAQVGHVFLDVPTRRLRLLNSTARALHRQGVPMAPEELAQHPLQFPNGATVEASDFPLLQTWRDSQGHEAVFALVRPDLSFWQVRMTASPLLDAQEELIGVFGTVAAGVPDPDWSALAGLAHDLRTPLQSVQMIATLIESEDHLSAEVLELSSRMRSSAERAVAIARELLELCRKPVQRLIAASRNTFPLPRFLNELIQEHKLTAQRKGLTLVCEIDVTEGWQIQADRVRLGRLLSNLLLNAIGYTPNGRVELKAQWRHPPLRDKSDPFGSPDSAVLRRPSLVLSVVDTGVGIATEEQEVIFQPYERGRAATQEAGGSGVGLAIVDRLVEELGLSLEVYSQFGKGSAFDLVIPPRLLHHRDD